MKLLHTCRDAAQTLPQTPLYILMMCTAHEADLISVTPAHPQPSTHSYTHSHTVATDATTSLNTGIKVNGSKRYGNETFPSKYSYLFT